MPIIELVKGVMANGYEFHHGKSIEKFTIDCSNECFK